MRVDRNKMNTLLHNEIINKLSGKPKNARSLTLKMINIFWETNIIIAILIVLLFVKEFIYLVGFCELVKAMQVVPPELQAMAADHVEPRG